jgi:L-ribulose-5-phosphate 4-epimerase
VLQSLREAVLEANLDLVRNGLVISTFGNASGIARKEQLVVIKPSGVPYDAMKPSHLVICDMDGRVVEGDLRPSSDLPTHLVLYKSFPEIGGVAHTHSPYATAWAQARTPIPCFGTTHADYFYGQVPVTEVMKDQEIAEDYEKNTGEVIARAFKSVDPNNVPGVLVANHGPFTWGTDAKEAAHNALMLEAVARTAFSTLIVNPKAETLGKQLLDKHYLRKHGRNAYYGQTRKEQ